MNTTHIHQKRRSILEKIDKEKNDLKRISLLMELEVQDDLYAKKAQEELQTKIKKFAIDPKSLRDNTVSLSKRELQIVRMISTNLISREIAKELSISIRTVDAHRSNIMNKLGVKNAAEMISTVYKLGLIN